MNTEKEKTKCTAIVEHGRINLIISKNDNGYDEFAKVIDDIGKEGIMIFYGDVKDENGKEQTGIIITSKPRTPSLSKKKIDNLSFSQNTKRKQTKSQKPKAKD